MITRRMMSYGCGERKPGSAIAGTRALRRPRSPCGTQTAPAVRRAPGRGAPALAGRIRRSPGTVPTGAEDSPPLVDRVGSHRRPRDRGSSRRDGTPAKVVVVRSTPVGFPRPPRSAASHDKLHDIIPPINISGWCLVPASGVEAIPERRRAWDVFSAEARQTPSPFPRRGPSLIRAPAFTAAAR